MLPKKVRRLLPSKLRLYTVVVPFAVSVTFFSNLVDPPPLSESESLSFLQELKTRAAITPAIMNSFFINLYCVVYLKNVCYFTRRGVLLYWLYLYYARKQGAILTGSRRRCNK